jgi:hypothetical protein
MWTVRAADKQRAADFIIGLDVCVLCVCVRARGERQWECTAARDIGADVCISTE